MIPPRTGWSSASRPAWRAKGAVGLAFPSGEGIAGYVFTTGQPLAVSDVASDPRFDRAAAERTGYVPRSILAVPLLDDSGSIGVLEVLDRHGDQGFGLRDLDLASVFARQAAVAIRASRVERDATELLRLTLARLAADPEADSRGPRRRGRGDHARPGRRRGCAPVGPGRRGRPGPAGCPGPGRARRGDPRCARAARVAACAAVVPPVTELPAWGEPFAAGHRDSLARSGPWGRADRAWAFGDGIRPRAAGGDRRFRGRGLAPRGGRPAGRGGRRGAARRGLGRGARPSRRTWSATGRRARASSTASRPRRSSCRCASWARTTAATGVPSRPGCCGRSSRRGRRW